MNEQTEWDVYEVTMLWTSVMGNSTLASVPDSGMVIVWALYCKKNILNEWMNKQTNDEQMNKWTNESKLLWMSLNKWNKQIWTNKLEWTFERMNSQELVQWLCKVWMNADRGEYARMICASAWTYKRRYPRVRAYVACRATRRDCIGRSCWGWPHISAN
jgi:hypothetical protein